MGGGSSRPSAKEPKIVAGAVVVWPTYSTATGLSQLPASPSSTLAPPSSSAVLEKRNKERLVVVVRV